MGTSASITVVQPDSDATFASTKPQSTGVVAGCRKYHTVKSGETCQKIKKIYDITFDQILKWNPSGKSMHPAFTKHFTDAV